MKQAALCEALSPVFLVKEDKVLEKFIILNALLNNGAF
jgi:hypothetical protein